MSKKVTFSPFVTFLSQFLPKAYLIAFS